MGPVRAVLPKTKTNVASNMTEGKNRATLHPKFTPLDGSIDKLAREEGTRTTVQLATPRLRQRNAYMDRLSDGSC